MATDLDFIFSKVRPHHSQRMLAHLFSVYGAYAPRGFTNWAPVLPQASAKLFAGLGFKMEHVPRQHFSLEALEGEQRD